MLRIAGATTKSQLLQGGVCRSFAAAATAVKKPPPKTTTNPPEPRPITDSQSFCMNLFRGRAILDQVFPYPLQLDNDRRETLSMILAPTEKFFAEVNNAAKYRAERLSENEEVLAQFAKLGAFGAVVPEEYEGAGLNNTQMARLAEVVGANDLALGVVMGAHQSIGYKGILIYGNDSQKRKYLPDLAAGRRFAAFCLTEPSSGSDAQSIRTRAELSPDGKHYVLNGGKIWISNGGFADVFTVFAQTPCRRADGTVKDKISAFIVERAFPGVTSGPPEKKMGIKGSNTAEVHFENVKVPKENLLGPEGDGFKVAMNILNNGRFGIPAACTGAMKMCIAKTIEHVTTRVQFGHKLMTYGNVQEKLTEMLLRHYATESIVYMLASNMDRGIMDYQLEAAIGKIAASENAWWVCDEAIQLHGGMGFMSETGLERVLRDLRIFRIFEGANDILRLFIALTGMQYGGRHLQQVMRDMKSARFFTAVGEVIRQKSGKNGVDCGGVVDGRLKDSATLLNACINQFGSSVFSLLRKHGKSVVDRQYELIRVANAAIDIYSMAAVLSRATRAVNAPSAEHEQRLATLFVRQAAKRVQEQLRQCDRVSESDLTLISTLANDVCARDGLVQVHPLEV